MAMQIRTLRTLRTLPALAVFCLIVTGAAARADQQQDDQSACMMDAQTICKEFIPDRERVAHCLMANRARITRACRVALRHFK